MSSFTETQQDYEKLGLERMDKYREELKLLNYSSNELLELVARLQAKTDILEEICDSLAAKNDNLEMALSRNSEIEIKEIITPTMIKMYRSGANKMYLEVKAAQAEEIKKHRTEGGYAKRDKDNDGKQKAKAFIKECWDKWQLEPHLYKSPTAFAKDMLEKQDALINQSVIVGFCTKWTNEASSS